jgi:PAS domain S-box-containing protein
MTKISERLSVLPVESWLDFYIKNYKKITVVFTCLLLGVILLLGWTSAKKIREVVIEDFNNQQLVLARHAASQIENNLNIFRRELTLLAFSPAVQYTELVQMGRRMGIVFSSLKDDGCLEIRFVEAKRKKTYLVDNQGYRPMETTADDVGYLEWAEWKENKGKIQTSDVSPVAYGNRMRTVMRMALPVWQVSVDDAHPVATNEFSGVLIFVVDASSFAEKVSAGIRSGKTGYSWVIDNKGVFLYHPETEFIGRSAFEARKERKPTISFSRINEIQKEMILKGKEGTSWYVSGWHRGVQGEMKKLIAYAPIWLGKEENSPHWSVAVVAPTSEVEGAIQGIQARQFLLEGISILLLFCSGLLIVAILLRWSSTIKKEVEEKTKELKISENHWRSLIEHADDIIFTVDSRGTILSMNGYGHRFFEKKQEEIVGKSTGELFSEESNALIMKEIGLVVERNVSEQVTCSTQVKGGERWLSINFSGLLDEENKVYGVLGIARDITERKKIEQQMAHTEKLASVGTLAAGVAHEINNPLTIMLGFTEMLLEKAPVGSEDRDLLDTIEKHGLNAKRIVENLLGFARYTEHKEQDVDINGALESVLAVITNNLAIRKITMIKDLAPSMTIVMGDAGELQQVFFNLISNAIGAMKGGGTLVVSTRPLEDIQRVEIRVSDTGTGIPKDIRPKIFDPFFTTKKVGEGTGLGLSISYGIVSKHGGTMSFETRTAGESATPGTTFIITLPVKKQS